MSNKTSTLETALSRHITANNTEIVNDRESFDLIAGKFVSKKSALLAMKEYLKSSQASPRVLGLLVYSTQGNRLLREWVGQGMSTKLLYQGLMYDGAFWQRSNAELPIAYEIIMGDESWDFEPKDYFSTVELLTSIPGAVKAMVARFRALGRMDEIFKAMPLFTLRDLLAYQPEIFEPEINALSYGKHDLHDDWASFAAIDLMKHNLNDQGTLRKMLGMKVA